MKNDKLLIAFLVSAGLFSTVQAEQYVSGLSLNQKQTLLSVKSVSGDIRVTSGSYYGDGPDENK